MVLHDCCFLFPALFQKKLVTADFVETPVLLKLMFPRDSQGALCEGGPCEGTCLSPSIGMAETPGKREGRGLYERHTEQGQPSPCKNCDRFSKTSRQQVTRRLLSMQQVIKLCLATGCGRYQKFPGASRPEHGRRTLYGSFDTKTLLLA